jgi:hypothetical protein
LHEVLNIVDFTQHPGLDEQLVNHGPQHCWFVHRKISVQEIFAYGEVYKFSSYWNLIAGKKSWGVINVKAPSSQRISCVSKKPYSQFATIFFFGNSVSGP